MGTKSTDLKGEDGEERLKRTEPIGFYGQARAPKEWRSFRKEVLSLEREHLQLRLALRDAEESLHADPRDEALKARVDELKKNLEELERQAPWISTDVPVEMALWGVCTAIREGYGVEESQT